MGKGAGRTEPDRVVEPVPRAEVARGDVVRHQLRRREVRVDEELGGDGGVAGDEDVVAPRLRGRPASRDMAQRCCCATRSRLAGAADGGGGGIVVHLPPLAVLCVRYK